MFVISQSESYQWPITVEFPTDGGKFVRQTFNAQLKRLSQSRIGEIKKAIDDNSTTDNELAREILIGWSGIQDADGNEVPFTEAMRDRLLDIPLVAAAIVFALIESLSGAKRKN